MILHNFMTLGTLLPHASVNFLQDTAEVAEKAFLLLYSVAGLGLLPPAERDGCRQSLMVGYGVVESYI